MEAVDEVAELPRLSRTVTVGGPNMELPVVVLPGCIVNARALAAPGLTPKAVLSAGS